MDGSQKSLLQAFPLVLHGASKDNWGNVARDLRYGCRSWVRDVQGLSGIVSTIPSWQRLYRRGRRLSSRMARLSKLSSFPLPRPLDTK